MSTGTCSALVRMSALALYLAVSTGTQGYCAPLFPNPQYYPHRFSSLVTSSDFNHDGRPDLAEHVLGGIQIFLGLGDGTFESGAFVPVALEPFGAIDYLTLGDFNGDHLQDFVLSIDSPNFSAADSISVILGRSDGTFGPEIRTTVGSQPQILAVGDFNGDGHEDLIVPNGNLSVESTVSILLGRGDGTFSSSTRVVGRSPQVAATGDFNGDGKVDAAVLGRDVDADPAVGGYLALLLGQGDGTFASGATFILPVTSTSSDVRIRDINADGLDDIVVLVAPAVFIFLGRGDGTFTESSGPSCNCQGRFDLVDLNHDGKVDFAGGWLGALLGHGDGTFTQLSAPFQSPALPSAVADFNGDGSLDIAMSSINTVYLGRGDGTFVYPTTRSFVSDLPFSMRGADLNLDGLIDLVSGSTGNSIVVDFGLGDGFFAPPVGFRTGNSVNSPRAVAVGDLNGDGRPDLVSANFQMNTEFGIPPWSTSVLIGDGTGQFAAPMHYGVGSAPKDALIGDLDGDGREDVVIANSGSNDVSVLRGNGDGTLAAEVRYDAGASPSFLAMADLDADGRNDLVVANNASADVSVLLGAGDGTLRPQVRFGAGAYPTSLAIGDFNSDGRLDVAVANDTPFSTPDATLPGAVAILFGNGDGTLGPRTELGVGEGVSRLITADFNSDGRLDIAVAYYFSHTVSMFLSGPDGNLSPESRFSVFPNPSGLVAGDFDASGFVDLLAVVGGPSTAVFLPNQSCEPDSDDDGVCDTRDNCPFVANFDQRDSNQNGIGDACDDASFPFPVAVSYTSPAGKGSGVVSWTTTHEFNVRGFNVVEYTNRGVRTQLNPTLIQCDECVTGLGAPYSFVVSKHRGGRDVFIEVVERDGSVLLFGPALRE